MGINLETHCRKITTLHIYYGVYKRHNLENHKVHTSLLYNTLKDGIYTQRCLVVGRTVITRRTPSIVNIEINHQVSKQVQGFKHLESMLTSDGRLYRETDRRIIKVNKVFFFFFINSLQS